MKILNDDGDEIEVFTAEERDAYANTLVEQKVGETKAEYEARIKERDDNAGNIGNLRKISEERLAKLSETERLLYENQQALEKERLDKENAEKARYEALVEAEIKAKANGNADLEKKIRDNLALVNIDPRTPEQVVAKVAIARGGVFEQNPDMLAVVGGYTGSVYPGGNNPPAEEKKSYADTPEGQKAMAAAGFLTDEQVKAAQAKK